MLLFYNMARNYNFAPGEYYHIYNRGVEKRKIFLKKGDYQRFQFLLYICNNNKKAITVRDYRGLTSVEKYNLQREGTLVDIGAYCLMPNHFHLLLREKTKGGISLFLQKITTGYTMYFNQINKRSGSLFQGSFQAKHADEDRYLKYLYAYIHLNPLKIIDSSWKEKGIKSARRAEEFLTQYSHSSFLEYIGQSRPENSILNPSEFPDYFQDNLEFNEFIKDWFTINQEFTEV